MLNDVKVIRWELGLTLRDLSKLSGVNYATIDKIENGLIMPTQLTMMKISKGLNRPTHEVFHLDWKTV